WAGALSLLPVRANGPEPRRFIAAADAAAPAATISPAVRKGQRRRFGRGGSIRRAARDSIADILGATRSSRACPVRSRRGAVPARAPCPRCRAVVPADRAVCRAVVPADRAVMRADAAYGATWFAALRAWACAMAALALIWSRPFVTCVFVMRDTVEPPQMYIRLSHFPARARSTLG